MHRLALFSATRSSDQVAEFIELIRDDAPQRIPISDQALARTGTEQTVVYGPAFGCDEDANSASSHEIDIHRYHCCGARADGLLGDAQALPKSAGVIHRGGVCIRQFFRRRRACCPQGTSDTEYQILLPLRTPTP